MNKLKKHGLPENYFDRVDLEKESNEKTHELCKWIKENDRNPSQLSKDMIEKRLHSFINTRRVAKSGNTRAGGVYYESNDKILLSYGLKGLFDATDNEYNSNQKTHKLCKWTMDNKRNPVHHTKDKVEKSLSLFLGSQKTSKLGKGNGVYYKSNEKILLLYGLESLFNSGNEFNSNKRIHELCKWIKGNGREPREKSKDKIEKKLNSLMTNQRSGKMGKGTMVYYKSNDKILISYGLEGLFDKSGERISNKRIHELCKWVKGNRKIPSSKSEDKVEKRMNNFLSNHKALKSKKGRGVYYESNEKILLLYGLEVLFEPGNGYYSNQRTHELCEWIKDNKRNPFQLSEDKAEKGLASWLSGKKIAKQGRGHSHFYPSDQAIAESYGFNDLFKTRTKV